MTATLIDLRKPRPQPNDLPSLRAALVQQLVGEAFLFGRMAYAEELVLHFGTPREYTVPRFGKRTEGSHALSVRGSAWLIKSGAQALAAQAGLLPEELAGASRQPLTPADLAAGPLVSPDARVVAASPFVFEAVLGYGLELVLSDGSRITILPSAAEPPEPGDEALPEIADWELLSPQGSLKVGPGTKWTFTPAREPATKIAPDA